MPLVDSDLRDSSLSAAKILGIILLVLSLPLLGLAVMYLGSEEPPVAPFIGDEPSMSAYVLLGVAALFIVLGIILLLVKPRAAPAPVVVAAPAPPQEITIKRTEMNWGTQPVAASPTAQLESALDAVNQKIGRLKVQYGMGEISNESYKRMMVTYESEKAQIEQQILETG